MKSAKAVEVLRGLGLALICVSGLATPALAKVVEFNATWRDGFGSGGTYSHPSNGANGLPICNKGATPHPNASVPAHGLAEVSSGAAPQSIMALRPFSYGSAGPTGPTPTSAKPGIAGGNGAAEYFSSTCVVVVPASQRPSRFNSLTVSSRFRWPAQYTVTTDVVATMGGGSASRLVTGTGPEAHTLAASAGPGPFQVVANPTETQLLSGVAGSNRFGGGFRASGEGRRVMNLSLGPGLSAVGYFVSGPRMHGHGNSPKTQVATNTGTFTTRFSGMINAQLRVWNMPFTTGMVHVEDHGGDFTTILDATGADNRTPLGEMGSLLLVSPWTANVTSAVFYYSGITSLEFQFLPEPGATAALVCGLGIVLSLHRISRRS